MGVLRKRVSWIQSFLSFLQAHLIGSIIATIINLVVFFINHKNSCITVDENGNCVNTNLSRGAQIAILCVVAVIPILIEACASHLGALTRLVSDLIWFVSLKMDVGFFPTASNTWKTKRYTQWHCIHLRTEDMLLLDQVTDRKKREIPWRIIVALLRVCLTLLEVFEWKSCGNTYV